MSVSITGTVTAPAAIRTHTEPTSPFSGGSIAGGGNKIVSVGPFKNTGNVDQTLTLADVSGLVNCTISEFYITPDGVTNDGHSFTVAPGREVTVMVNVNEPTSAPGTPDATYSFNLDTSWA